MACPDIYHRLDAFVDGETSSEQTSLIERHLMDCAGCQARVDALRALSGTVRRELGAEQAPWDLWTQIERRLPPAAENADPVQLEAWWYDRVRPLALAASVVLLLGVGGTVAWWQAQADYSVIAAPVQDFTTYRLSGRGLDVESRNPAVVEAWFEERLAFEPPRIKARIAGFELVGGRLCWFLDRRVSALAYQRGDQMISVYVMAAHDLPLPEATFEPRLAISRSVHQVDLVRNMIWHEGNLVYAVVSDLEKDDLSIFLAALARSKRHRAAANTDSIEHPAKTIRASI